MLPRRLKVIAWMIVIAIGSWQAWQCRYAMNADGVSYLDVADAYLRGDWHLAVNGYWSPLYSWLLALALWLFQPDRHWEYPLVHLVNLVSFLLALVCFNYLLNRLREYRRAEAVSLLLPEGAFFLSAHFLFLWATVALVTLKAVTPDLLVAAVVFLLGGFLTRIRLGDYSRRTFALLGLVLGLGYLTKAILFLAAFLFLAVSLSLVRQRRLIPSRAAIALAGFLLLAAPFFCALSLTKGRLTFGDSGRLNYAWYVNGVQRHAQGTLGEQGVSSLVPRVYEFREPFTHATHPMWYDASYWYENVRPQFSLSQQLMVLRKHGGFFVDLFRLAWPTPLPIHLFFPLLMLSSLALLWGARKSLMRYWWLLIPSCLVMALYALVHLEERLIAPFIALVLLALFSAQSLPRYWQRPALAGLAILLVGGLGPALYRPLVMAETVAPTKYYDIAREIGKLGLPPREKIASLGWAEPQQQCWARLLKLRIVAETYASDRTDVASYWRADQQRRQQLMDAFRQAGATLVVTEDLPVGVTATDVQTAGWRPLGATGVYFFWLREANAEEALRP